MVDIENLNIELLNSAHDKQKFDCGILELNDYLKKYAKQNSKKKFSKVHIISDNQEKILGYYSISSGQLAREQVPKHIEKGLPNYPVPTLLIGRLAVDINYHRMGIGKELLLHACYTCQVIEEKIGVFGLMVNAKNEQAKTFYEKYGFISTIDDELTLILPVKDMPHIE